MFIYILFIRILPTANRKEFGYVKKGKHKRVDLNSNPKKKGRKGKIQLIVFLELKK